MQLQRTEPLPCNKAVYTAESVACDWAGAVMRKLPEQGRIHGIRCYETPFSAKKEKALQTYGWMDGRMDGRTDGHTLL